MDQPFQAIIFDCDGVLVDSAAANVATYQNLMRAAGYPVPSRAQLHACSHMTFEHRLVFLLGRPCSNKELRRFKQLLVQPGIRTPQLLRFPESLETILQALSADYRLGIATSRSQLGMNDVLEQRPIAQYFNVIVAREDYEQPKPAAEPLLLAAGRLQVHPARCAYVGDNASDVTAALAAGMTPVYLGKSAPEGARHIRTLADVRAVLA